MRKKELTRKQKEKLKKCGLIKPVEDYVADIWTAGNEVKPNRIFDPSIGNKLFLCNLILANLLLWFDFLFVYDPNYYLIPLAALLVICVEFVLHITKMTLLIGKIQRKEGGAFTEQALDLWQDNTNLSGLAGWLNNIMLITVSFLSLPMIGIITILVCMLITYYLVFQIKEMVNAAVCAITARKAIALDIENVELV